MEKIIIIKTQLNEYIVKTTDNVFIFDNLKDVEIVLDNCNYDILEFVIKPYLIGKSETIPYIEVWTDEEYYYNFFPEDIENKEIENYPFEECKCEFPLINFPQNN
jgi:hypothetical protein